MSGGLLELRSQADALAAGGRPPPCLVDPEPFTSDDPRARAEAAAACTTACRLLELCGLTALMSEQRWHVWGGVDVTTLAHDPSARRAILAAHLGNR